MLGFQGSSVCNRFSILSVCSVDVRNGENAWSSDYILAISGAHDSKNSIFISRKVREKPKRALSPSRATRTTQVKSNWSRSVPEEHAHSPHRPDLIDPNRSYKFDPVLGSQSLAAANASSRGTQVDAMLTWGMHFALLDGSKG